MSFSIGRFISFAVAGAISVGAYLLFNRELVADGSSPLVLAMVGYVLLAAIAMGFAGSRTVLTLASLWMVAVLLISFSVVGAGPPPTGLAMALAIGLICGTLAFVLLVAVGGAVAALMRTMTR